MNSRLYLETEVRDKKTYIKDVFFKAPYKIMSPFTDEKTGGIQIMLMSASAGLLAGDTFESDLVLVKILKLSIHLKAMIKYLTRRINLRRKMLKLQSKRAQK